MQVFKNYMSAMESKRKIQLNLLNTLRYKSNTNTKFNALKKSYAYVSKLSIKYKILCNIKSNLNPIQIYRYSFAFNFFSICNIIINYESTKKQGKI